MDLSVVTLIVASASVLSAVVGFVSAWISKRQKEAAADLQESAGVRSIERIDEQGDYKSLNAALQQHPPRYRLRVLVTSGLSLIQTDRELLTQQLQRGVAVDVLMLDPDSNNPLFSEHSWLQKESAATGQALSRLNIQHPDLLRVRFHSQTLLELLMFIDEDRLFLSSYFPLARSERFVYQISNGPRSLYRLYNDAFEYLWSRAAIK
jgi:hypothetical protein